MEVFIVGFIAGIIIGIAILSILVLKRRGWKRTVDYRQYFNIGIVWLPFGIVMSIIFENPGMGIIFSLMGLAFLAAGLKNRDKWGKPQKIDPRMQKIMAISISAGIILLVLGIIVFMLLV